MSRSTQTSRTQPCRLRFFNNSEQSVDILWVTYEATEQLYANVPPNSQHVQATFTTHPWVVRLASSKDVLGQYIGDTAVLEILPHLGCQVHPGTAKHIRPRSVPTPLHWGTYRLRCRVRGIAIMAFDCVPEQAISDAAEALQYMLANTPPSICARLAENDADIAIIGRDQVVSDMPPHSHLRGQACAIGDRTFDKGTRGVGGNLGCPTSSVGEENVTTLDDRHYSQENILIHEFAHSVMCIGMDDEQRQSICAAYDEAVQSGLYQRHIYMMANADEYWAEATQAWFDATVCTDVNDGFNTREKLKAHDPLLATLLMHAYGDNLWRYTHTMPRNWGGKPRTSPMRHPQQQQLQHDKPQFIQPSQQPQAVEPLQQQHSQDVVRPEQQPLENNQHVGYPTLSQPIPIARPQRHRSSSFCCFPFALLAQTLVSKLH